MKLVRPWFVAVLLSSSAWGSIDRLIECERSFIRLKGEYEERLSGDYEPFKGIFNLAEAEEIARALRRDPKVTPFAILERLIQLDQVERLNLEWLEKRLRNDLYQGSQSKTRLQGNLSVLSTVLQSVRSRIREQQELDTPAQSPRANLRYLQTADIYRPSPSEPQGEGAPKRKSEKREIGRTNLDVPRFVTRTYSTGYPDGTLKLPEHRTRAEDRPGRHMKTHEWVELRLSQVAADDLALFIPEGYIPLQVEDSRMGEIYSPRTGEYRFRRPKGENLDLRIALEPERPRFLTNHELAVYQEPIGVRREAWPESVQRFLESIEGDRHGEALDPIKIAGKVQRFIESQYVYVENPSPFLPLLSHVENGELNCHWAGLMAAAILRDVFRIPTRFRVGNLATKSNSNSVGHDSVLMESEALHLWIEVYANGRWYPFDPTPSRSSEENTEDDAPSSEARPQSQPSDQLLPQARVYDLSSWLFQALISEAIHPNRSPHEIGEALERYEEIKSRMPISIQKRWGEIRSLASRMDRLEYDSTLDGLTTLSASIGQLTVNEIYDQSSLIREMLSIVHYLHPPFVDEGWRAHLSQALHLLNQAMDLLASFDDPSTHREKRYHEFLETLPTAARDLYLKLHSGSQVRGMEAFYQGKAEAFERIARFLSYTQLVFPRRSVPSDSRYESLSRDLSVPTGLDWVRTRRFSELLRARLGRPDLAPEVNLLQGTAYVRGRRKVFDSQARGDVGQNDKSIAVLLLDRSGSMLGRRSDTQEALVQALALHLIQHGDEVVILPFSDRIFEPVHVEGVEGLLDVFRGLPDIAGAARGATRLEEALIEGLGWIKRFQTSSDREVPYAHLVVLTDGEGEFRPDRILEASREISDRSEFLFAVGSISVPSPRLRALTSRFERGHYFEVLDGDQDRLFSSSALDRDSPVFSSHAHGRDLPGGVQELFREARHSLERAMIERERFILSQSSTDVTQSPHLIDEIKAVERWLIQSTIALDPNLRTISKLLGGEIQRRLTLMSHDAREDRGSP